MQNLEDIESFCLQMPGVSTDFPFGEETMVFRVMDKIFLLTNIFNIPLSMNLKAIPEQAIQWREEYQAVQPGYHMNKKHWNTVTIDGSVSSEVLHEMIVHSYECVRSGLTKKQKEELKRIVILK